MDKEYSFVKKGLMKAHSKTTKFQDFANFKEKTERNTKESGKKG